MDKHSNVTGFLLLVVLGVVGSLTYTYLSPPTPDSDGAGSDAEPSFPSVIDTAKPTVRTFRKEIPWIGVVESQTLVELRALMAGRVESIEVQDETPIEPKVTVMKLGGPQVESKRSRLEAEIQSAESDLDLADRLAKHLAELHGEKLATNEQFTAAEQNKIDIQSKLQDAQLALKAFEKETQIVGPIPGVFTDRRVSPGQSVQASEGVGAIIDPDHLRIVATVHTKDGAALRDKEATIRLDANQSVTAVVQRVLAQRSETGLAKVWIEGPAVNADLRPGQTVGGTVVVDTVRDALAVPESAVVYDSEERPCVFVANGNTSERRDVEIGPTQDGWVEIRSGLKPDESVVTQGAYELFYRDFNERYKVQD